MAENEKEDQEKPKRPVIRFEKRNLDLDIKVRYPNSDTYQTRVDASISPDELRRALENLKNTDDEI